MAFFFHYALLSNDLLSFLTFHNPKLLDNTQERSSGMVLAKTELLRLHVRVHHAPHVLENRINEFHQQIQSSAYERSPSRNARSIEVKGRWPNIGGLPWSYLFWFIH